MVVQVSFSARSGQISVTVQLLLLLLLLIIMMALLLLLLLLMMMTTVFVTDAVSVDRFLWRRMVMMLVVLPTGR